MGRPKRPEEALAKVVVEALEDVQLEATDVKGAPDGTCDFAVRRSGEVVGALEVTMLVDEDRARFDGSLYSEPVLAAPELSGDWIVALSQEAIEQPKGINSIRLNVVRALAELEVGGIDKFTRDEMRPYRILFGMEERPPLLIDDLPVNFANRGDEGDQKSHVFLLAPAGGGRVWAGNAHAAIEDALAGSQLSRKIQKLERTELPERHLFVWIGVSLFEANFT